jgi:phosphate transport system permease protein
MLSWPRLVTALAALVPVGAFAFIVASVVAASVPAITELGAGLLGTQFAGTNQHQAGTAYGLVAPLYGTVLMALIALVIAVPGAIALAVLMEELPLGWLGRALPPTLGFISGIPPIVYALLGLVLLEAVMRPKFGAIELDDEHVKAAIQGLPTFSAVRLPIGLPNSQLLGGVVLALLIVPLIAPLVADALHGVPLDLRRASYALGAGRWHTLMRVVLPSAMPGIIGAATLGALKAAGEVTIPYFFVSYGLEVVHLPSPLWDVLGHTQPLSSTGAIILGGFNTEGHGTGVQGLPLAVAYTSGAILLLLAFALMGCASVVHAWLTRGARR